LSNSPATLSAGFIARNYESRTFRLIILTSPYTALWWRNLKERDHLGDPGVDGRIMLRWIFRKWDVGVWTGFSWLWIGTGGGHLRLR
jgi:hypothetical protein